MSDPVIEIRELSRRFGSSIALDHIDLCVAEGTVLGLIGPNGAGKTTLIKHILGLLRSEQGSTRVFGLDPVADPEGVLSRIGYVSEERDLPGWMRIRDLYRYTRAFFPNWDDALVTELTERFQLDVGQKVKTLSRGQHVRTALVLALAHRPPLLVLDEPSSGLDPVVRRDVLESIVHTTAQSGSTVLFSSHLLDEVERLSDRLAMIVDGRIVVHDELDGIRQRHWCFAVHYDGPGAPLANVDGVLKSKPGLSPGECEVIGEGDPEELARALTAQGVSVLERRPTTLDEVFLARIDPAHSTQTAAHRTDHAT